MLKEDLVAIIDVLLIDPKTMYFLTTEIVTNALHKVIIAQKRTRKREKFIGKKGNGKTDMVFKKMGTQ